MVTDLLLNLVLAPIAALFHHLPGIGAGLGMHSLATTITTSSFWPDLGWANNYLPLDLAATLMGILITTTITMLGIRVTLWVYHQFWGSN
jgi:hypothetical protein